MKTIRAFILLVLLAVGMTAPAQAQSDIDSRWGVLADLAERDFYEKAPPLTFEAGAVYTFRWRIRNQVLVRAHWYQSKNAAPEQRYELNFQTGVISTKDAGGRDLEVMANAAGELVRRDNGAKYIWRAEDGNFRLTYSNQGMLGLSGAYTIRPLVPSSREGRMLQKAIAGGLVQPGDPSDTSQVAAQAPQTAPSTSRPSVAAPPALAAGEPVAPSPRPVTGPVRQGPRLALVIGNSTYGGSLGTLANPGNDARLIAAGLRAVGFQVELVLDANQRTMKQAIARLGQRLRATGGGATGLFYYAGHGMQSRGANFLIPVGAAIAQEADVDLEAVAADAVLSQMEAAGASTNIVILDACRNTPVVRNFRGGTRGLARMEAPNGSFLSYSTAPGSVAQDGSGQNSPFAQALNSELLRPGQPIEITFRNVRRKVLEATSGQQTPWDSSSLVDSFVFKP